MKLRKLMGTVVVASVFISSVQVCQADLYGALEKKGNNFSFSIIQNSQPSSYAVDLNNKAPVNYDLEQKECLTHLWNKEVECVESKNNFRVSRTKYLKTTLINTIGIPFFMWLKYGFTTFKDDYFVRAAFDDAVNMACQGDNIDTLINEYNDFYDYAQRKSFSYKSVAESRATAIHAKYQAEARSLLSSAEISYKVVDMTGFWKSNASLPKISLPLKRLGPFSAELPYNKLDIAAPPAEFRREVKKASEKFDTLYNEKVATLDTSLSSYEAALAKESKELDLPQANAFMMSNFRISSDYVAKREGKLAPKVTVTYTIEYKNFYDVYPKYRNSDENLEIVFDGKNMVLVNKSDRFLKLTSISIYYNTEVYNFTDFGDVELPPETRKDFNCNSLLNARNIKDQAQYEHVTRDKVKKDSISFGFAAKYRTADQPVDKTLYKSLKYNTYDVLLGAS